MVRALRAHAGILLLITNEFSTESLRAYGHKLNILNIKFYIFLRAIVQLHTSTRHAPDYFYFIPEQIVFKEEQIMYRFERLDSGTIA